MHAHPEDTAWATTENRGRIDTITAVLELAEQPMPARDIHITAEKLLGRPIKWTSVKATLAEHACGPRIAFSEPATYGRYRVA